MSERFVVARALEGERVDRAVALLTGLSRAAVALLVDTGRVTLAGEVVTVRHVRVVEGATLEVDVPDESVSAERPVASDASIAFEVVAEDDDLVVVDKPAGLVVHPGAGHVADTLVSGLLARYPDLEALAIGEARLRPGIVHRLDKDTSGLLVVARNEHARRVLTEQLADRTMARTYRSLVIGIVHADEGIVDAPIGRSSRDPTRMTVKADGRAARSSYRVEARYHVPEATSLLEVHLETGRTHQIRVHFGAIGHPVAGDPRYGARIKLAGLRRPFLHAARLRFVHPGTGEVVEYASALPADLTGVLETLS